MTTTRGLALVLATVAVLGFGLPAAALDPDKAITQFRQDTWDTERGLPSNQINAILQTSDGYLWVGTTGGLARFNGASFTVFTKQNTEGLPADFVWALLEDHDGTLWVGTNEGLARYAEGRFTTVSGGLPFIDLTEDADGTVWAASWGLMRRVEGGRTVEFPSAGSLGLFVEPRRDGGVWVGSDAPGLRYLEGDRPEMQPGTESLLVRTLFEDREGRVWFYARGPNGGLFRLEGGKVERFGAASGLQAHTVGAIFQDRVGSLWFGTTGGLVRLANGRLTRYSLKDGLPDDAVQTLYEDREGSLWIGTGGAGLVRLRDGSFTTYTVKEGLALNALRTVYVAPDGAVWAGTNGNGASRLRDGVFTTFDRAAGLPMDSVEAITQDADGGIWFGAAAEKLAVRYQGGRFERFPGHGARTLLTDGDSVWLGVDGDGLYRYRAGRFEVFKREQPGGPFVWSLHKDPSGQVWAGIHGALCRPVEGQLECLPLPRTEHLIPPVLSLADDSSGGLWVGTWVGLFHFENQAFVRYGDEAGLPQTRMRAVMEDAQRDLWICTSNAILRVRRESLDRFRAGKVPELDYQVYDVTHGMKSSQFDFTGVTGSRAPDGRLWFASLGGLVVVDPTQVTTNERVPPVVIEEILVDQSRVEPAELERLRPGRGDVEVHYAGLSYLVPERVRFRYRLEGFDTGWIDAGTRRAAYYTNLPPGRYTFRVTACNNDGVWNPEGAQLPFTLPAPWYQTWWWRGLVALGLCGVAYGAYRRRVWALRARERELAAKVAERTADLQREVAEHERTEERLQEEVGQRQRAQEHVDRLNQELGERVEQRTAELATAYEALSAQSERLAVTLRSIGDGVIATDVEGRVELLNRVAEQLTGWTAAAAEGKPLATVFRLVQRDTRETLPDPCQTVLEQGAVFAPPREALLLARDRQERLVARSAAPIRDRESRIVGVVVVFRDVTERQKVEDQLRNAQKMEALTVLAGGIAHDFNNLLTGVFGFIDLARRRPAADGYIGHSLERALSVLEKARGLARQLLTFSKAGKPVTAPVALEELLGNCVRFVLSGSNVSYDLQVDSKLWPCQVDALQIDQAVANLLLNARQAMPEGGTVTLWLDNVMVPAQAKPPLPEGRYVRLTLRDQGGGIPQELQGRVFEPFFTTKSSGSGLGLATCYSIVRTHGGHVEMDSKPGAGTTFVVYLPAAAEGAAPAPRAQPHAAAGRGRVLVVDDEDYVREYTSEALTSLGYEVAVANGAEEAVKRFEEARARSAGFDVVILDLTAPGGTGGLATLALLRRIDPEVRAVASSGYSGDSVMFDPTAHGFRAALPKPYTLDELATLIASVLAEPR
jgi:PAS domain S-box-containing protein